MLGIERMGKLKKITEKLFKPKTEKKSGEGLYATLEELVEQRRYISYLKQYRTGVSVTKRAGDVKSAFKGRGMELEEIRSYTYGDDVRDIDWRVTARKQTPFTRLYAEEKDREIYVLLDLSAHMVFGTKKELKSVSAAKIASLLAWLSLENRDRFGCLVYNGEITLAFQPQNSRQSLMAVFKKIAAETKNVLRKSFFGSLAKPLQFLQKTVKSQAVVFVVSDFNEFAEDTQQALAALAKKASVYAVNVFDVLEEKAPKAGEYMAAEGTERLVFDTQPKAFRREYRAYFENKRNEVRTFCRRFAARYMEVRTDIELHRQLKI